MVIPTLYEIPNSHILKLCCTLFVITFSRPFSWTHEGCEWQCYMKNFNFHICCFKYNSKSLTFNMLLSTYHFLLICSSFCQTYHESIKQFNGYYFILIDKIYSIDSIKNGKRALQLNILFSRRWILPNLKSWLNK